RTERNDRKAPKQTDAADHGPEWIATQTIEKQCKYGAGGEDEVSHPARLQAAKDSKRHQRGRVHDRNPWVDPKHLIENKHVGQWSKQDHAELRGHNAREHRHVEAARHEVTGKSEASEGNQNRDVQR